MAKRRKGTAESEGPQPQDPRPLYPSDARPVDCKLPPDRQGVSYTEEQRRRYDAIGEKLQELRKREEEEVMAGNELSPWEEEWRRRLRQERAEILADGLYRLYEDAKKRKTGQASYILSDMRNMLPGGDIDRTPISKVIARFVGWSEFDRGRDEFLARLEREETRREGSTPEGQGPKSRSLAEPDSPDRPRELKRTGKRENQRDVGLGTAKPAEQGGATPAAEERDELEGATIARMTDAQVKADPMMEELRRTRLRMAARQKENIDDMQAVMRSLEGVNRGSFELNDALAREVQEWSKESGLGLFYEGRRVNLRCTTGVPTGYFQARSADSGQKTLYNEEQFPPLTIAPLTAKLEPSPVAAKS